jgi:hypothetical protein
LFDHDHDMFFLKHLSKKSDDLSEQSFVSKLFPKRISETFEILCFSKNSENDLQGLLGLICFAGFDFTDDQGPSKLCETVFQSSKKNKNWLLDSQKNLSSFLFGITLDDVSHYDCLNI